MTRDDVPGVALAAVIGSGLVWNLLGPHALGSLIDVGAGLLGVGVWAAVVTAYVIGVPMWWWGPVRVSRGRMRWMLSGPADRGVALRRALIRTLGVVIACGAATGAVVGALTRTPDGFLGVSVGAASGAVAAAAVAAGAFVAQMRRSARASTTGAPAHPIGRWHRDVVSPADGIAASARLLFMTADTEFVENARRVRWCSGRSAARRRRIVDRSAVRALVRADLVRLRRRPGDLVAWTAVVALTVALGSTTTMHSAAPAIAALLAYRAAGTAASGLRTVTTTPGFRRALHMGSGRITFAYSVIPSAAVLAWAAPAVPAMGEVPPVAWGVIVLGSIAAAIRRATRPELPWDAPVYITGQGGAAQPLLMMTLVRGHVAAVAVAVAACLV